MKTIEFNRYYKKFGFLSLILIIISLSLLFFKGLNYGVDFKGGTLIEIRIQNSDHSVSKVRDVFSDSNLPNLTVKNFGNDKDYIKTVRYRHRSRQSSPDCRSRLPKWITSGYDARQAHQLHAYARRGCCCKSAPCPSFHHL